MKIWFDILTPKEVLFFEPMVRDLKRKKKHRVLCTSRRYREASHLAEIRNLPVKLVGKHGGGEKFGKLTASVGRTAALSKIVHEYSPDVAVSFCSPEASRVAYGLGIKYVGFSDMPHATAIMKLSAPFLDKLLIPWIIPKSAFIKFGIDKNDIIQYNAIDPAIMLKRDVSKNARLRLNPHKKTILIRPPEDQASYMVNRNIIVPIINNVLKKYGGENIIVLSRYAAQRRSLTKTFGNKIKNISMSYDGKVLLEDCDVFIGSGGTMTAESALMGVPTISYDAVPNFYERYVVSKRLATREKDPKKIVPVVERMLSSKNAAKQRARKVVASMEDPYIKLVQVIKSIVQ